MAAHLIDIERAAEQALAADASIARFLRPFLAMKIECLRSARLKRGVSPLPVLSGEESSTDCFTYSAGFERDLRHWLAG